MLYNYRHKLGAGLAVVVLAGIALAADFVVSGFIGGLTASAESTVAKDARIGGDKQRTRFVADLSKKVSLRVFTLSDPYRVIVDLPDVRFQMPAGLGSKGRGLVTAFRFGLFAPGKSRIVIDVNAPVLVRKAFVLDRQNGQPARLVIDLLRTDRKTFLSRQSAALESKPKTKKRRSSGVAVGVPTAKKRSGRPVVVIDPGHGGVDSGAVSRNGVREKTVVFSFSNALKKALEARGRYRVLMTRSIDIFVPLRKRVEFARKNGASMFISIHADALPKRYAARVRGATIYRLSERASDEEARILAAKENRSDVIAGVQLPPEASTVTNILISLAQRETKNLSVLLSGKLTRQLRGKTRLHAHPQKAAAFRVLKAPDVPSVLLELGYLTNAEDEKLLTSLLWRQRIAKVVTQAIDKFFAASARGDHFHLRNDRRAGAKP